MFCHSAAEESSQLLGSCEASSVAAGDWDLLEQLGMPTGGVLREEEAVQEDSDEFSSIPEDPLPPAGGVIPRVWAVLQPLLFLRLCPVRDSPTGRTLLPGVLFKIHRTR